MSTTVVSPQAGLSEVRTVSRTAMQRIPAIDALRGLIMIAMALDHTRAFFTDLRFEPENVARTNLALFATRWVTHFCAPMFFLLAGTSAFLYAQHSSLPELRRFLWTRGLWLIVLEFTAIGTAWTFTFPWGFFGVIWALGASMVILSAVVALPIRWTLAVSIVIIAGHNLLDPLRPEQLGRMAWIGTLLHARGDIVLPFGLHQFVLFPLIPLAAVMSAGYGFGQLYLLDRGRRRTILMVLGLGLTLAFVVLRATNVYGNPPMNLGGVSQGAWQLQTTVEKTLILFFDVEKYPPSLQYLVMTIGPSVLLLALLDVERRPRGVEMLVVFGRVPMFFYVLHLYLIHGLAIVVAAVTGQPVRWLFHGAIWGTTPPDYGHGLAFVYVLWMTVVVVLYFPCRWFAELKHRRREWWLSYL
jgi:uncharacterized membrane protein